MLLAWQLLGCVTEIGNPEGDFEGSLAVLARSSNEQEVRIDDSAPLSVSEARLTIRRIRFEPADRCDDDDAEVDIEGPWTIDLVDSAVVPVALDGRAFCRLRLRIDRDEVDDDSLRVAGTRDDGVPFVVTSRINPSLELRADAGDSFVLPETLGGVALTLDLASLLTFDPDLLEVSSDGVIYIDEDRNPTAGEQVEDNLVDALDLRGDADGDGVLDEETDRLIAR